MSIDITVNYGVFGDTEVKYTANTHEAKVLFSELMGHGCVGFKAKKSYTQHYFDKFEDAGLCWNMEFRDLELDSKLDLED